MEWKVSGRLAMVTLRTRLLAHHCDVFITERGAWPRMWVARWRMDNTFEIGASKTKSDRDIRASTCGVDGLWKAGCGGESDNA